MESLYVALAFLEHDYANRNGVHPFVADAEERPLPAVVVPPGK